jgi:hypothetical protein
MLLKAQTPLSVPATVYDRIWVEMVEISAPSPDQDANAYVRLRRYALREDGTVATDPESFRLEVSNIIATSATDADLGAAFNSIMAYIAKAGIASGIIAPEPAE